MENLKELTNEELLKKYQIEKDYCNSMGDDDGNGYCYWLYHVEPIKEELKKRGIEIQ